MSTAARKCCVHVTSKIFLTNLLIGVSNTTNVNYADAWSCSLPTSISKIDSSPKYSLPQINWPVWFEGF